MEPGIGFEPMTYGLQNRCTTTVLTRQKVVATLGLEPNLCAYETHQTTWPSPSRYIII